MNLVRILSSVAVLLIGLVFYAGCRSEHTVSNHVLQTLLGPSYYSELRQDAAAWFSFCSGMHGCLPSLLWVAAVTCLLAGGSLRWHNRFTLPLTFLPTSVNALWELAQYAQLTDGRADAADLLAGTAGGVFTAALFYKATAPVLTPADLRRWQVLSMLLAFASMGLADVWK